MYCCVLAMLVATGSAPVGDPVAEAAGIPFHSSFWVNLHHTLYAVAQGPRPPDRDISRLGHAPAGDLPGAMSRDERTAWNRALQYYRDSLIDRDLRRGDGMVAITRALVRADGKLTQENALVAGHRRVLQGAAPVYRRLWWPEHDRRIRLWIDDVAGRIEAVGMAARGRLLSLLRVPWFADPPRVEITYFGRAYASTRPEMLTVLAAGDENYAGWSGAEMIFHEVGHGLTRELEGWISRAGAVQGRPTRGLWHVALFYIVGEVWKMELAGRGITYEPYLYATGLFDRAWRAVRKPVELNLGPYVAGAVDASTAVDRLVAALPSS